MTSALLDRPAGGPAETDDNATRRELVAAGLGVGALLLTGCGSDGDGDGAASENRRLRHFFGTTDVPAMPKRIHAADTGVLGNLLALEAPVAGTAEPSVAGGLDYLGDRLAGVRRLGSEAQPDLERVAALDPDLIVMIGADFARENYDALRRIAPTVGARYGYATVKELKDFLLACGQAVAREKRARELAAELDARIAQLGRRLDRTLGDRPVALLRVSEDNYSVLVGDTAAGLLEALGVSRPPGQQFDADKFSIELSLERLGELKPAHAIFVYTDAGAGTERERLERNPLWSRLPAVAAGRAHFVQNPVVWAIGTDVISVNLVLDEIEQVLAG